MNRYKVDHNYLSFWILLVYPLQKNKIPPLTSTTVGSALFHTTFSFKYEIG